MAHGTLTIQGRACAVDVTPLIRYGVDPDFGTACTGPIVLDVAVPPGASFSFAGDGGLGHGWTTAFTTDSSLNMGTDSAGPYVQIEVKATVPANLQPNGHEWNMTLALQASVEGGLRDDSERFITNHKSGKATVRA